MDALLRHVPVLLVFLTLFAASWLRGGTQTDAMLPVIPWLWALLFEVMLFFPQRRPYEDPVSARRRVLHRLGRDPLMWATVIFVLVLIVPFLNRGLCPVCDYPEIMKGRSPDPSIPFAPFCVDIPEHFNVVLWFVPSLTAMLAARHALSHGGKRMLIEMLVWNAAALAVLGFIQQATGADAPFWLENVRRGVFFSSFGYVNMGAAYFAMMFAFAIGVWMTRVSDVAKMPPIDRGLSIAQQVLSRLIKAHYPLIPAALIMYAVLATLCRAAMMCMIVLASIAFLYYECAMFFSRTRGRRAKNVGKAAIGLVGGVIIVISMFIFGPKGWTRELKSVSSIAVLDRVTGKAQYHSRVATELFTQHPAFGVGGWGYRHLCTKYMTDEELKQLQTDGGANVHNDLLQFLCEHGLVGFGLLAVIFMMLVLPIFRSWFKLYRASRFLHAESLPPSPRALYCLPAGTLWILLGDTALLICASGDCPMRSLAVMSAFFVSLACADGYLPHEDGGRR